MPAKTPAPDHIDLKRGIDHIGVTACFIVHDGAGNILLQKRSVNCRDEQGRWDIGGGAVEFGEPMETAVRREIREEYNTEAQEIKFLVCYEAFRQNGQIPTHWIALVHAVRVDPAKLTIAEPHKVDEIGWFTSSNLPKPLHSQFFNSFDVAKQLGIVR